MNETRWLLQEAEDDTLLPGDYGMQVTAHPEAYPYLPHSQYLERCGIYKDAVALDIFRVHNAPSPRIAEEVFEVAVREGNETFTYNYFNSEESHNWRGFRESIAAMIQVTLPGALTEDELNYLQSLLSI